MHIYENTNEQSCKAMLRKLRFQDANVRNNFV